MIREVDVNGTKFVFDLEYKKVKNINIRIKGDSTVHVSAPKRAPLMVIDGFVKAKAGFILNALEHFRMHAEKPKVQYCSEEELRERILLLCESAYPYYEKYCIAYPEIRFRNMVSRWGSCHKEKGILTFNLQLMYAPPECTEYVVWHEFTHFLEPNHSADYYKELEKVCPDWKTWRKKLKEVRLR